MGFFSFLKNNKYATVTLNRIKNKEEDEENLESLENLNPENNIEEGTNIQEEEKISWIKCPDCQNIVDQKKVNENHKKCTTCNHYFSMSARERIDLLIDEGTFIERNIEYISENPLDFPDYEEKYIEARNKLDLFEGVIEGLGQMNGIKVSIAAMDFDFMGGSMGSVVGEKITKAMERAIKEGVPVIVVSSSGGARMQEGMLSLMQMAKTSAAVEKLKNEKIPFISVPVNPTMGGVTASFAMLGDIIISEPNSRIGFAGPRVIEQTIRQKLPDNFQKSEFLQEHGMVDVISERENLKETITKILGNLV